MVESYAIIYVLGAIIALTIILMSLAFLIKALKRAKAIGMDKKVVVEAIKNSAIFSIVPSIPIVIGVGIMMQFVGLAIPWIRLTVIGALQYEILALSNAGAAVVGADEVTIATAVVVMTISIISGPLFNAIFYKKYQTKLLELQQKNERKMNAVTGALLGGMLAGIMSSLIVGGFFGIGNPVTDASGITTYGEITLITLAASVVLTGICGVILLVGKQKWIESYTLPISILGALAVAFLFVPVFA
jgi:hypothetical protein